MMRGTTSPTPETPFPEVTNVHSTLTTRILKVGCIALAGLFLANCANDQVARRKSKEIGAFPESKYGPASRRVIAEGQEVPKGGGRQLIGKTYSVAGKRYTPYEKPTGYTAVGTASWYGEAFHGRRTANGEIYDRHGISAAHPTMPLPAYARVTNVLNGRSIIVRVNDRGPYHGGRIMDVSQKTADALAFRHLGTARIKLEYLGQASLAGSDDRLLLATLRTDGQPASIPGTSARTMVASNAPVVPSRVESPDLADDAPAPAQAVAPTTVRAYAPPPTIAPQAPMAATLASTVSPGGVPMRAALPPSRPFDLDTIANAGSPVLLRTGLPAARPAARSSGSMTSLFAAPEQHPTARFARNHPLSASVVPQTLQKLSRN